MYTIPRELLPALCPGPYEAVSLRLTCTECYAAIPPVRELFVPMPFPAITSWSSGFWVITVLNATVPFVMYIQHRGPITAAQLVEFLKIKQSEKQITRVTKPSIPQPHPFMWCKPGIKLMITVQTGIQFIEDPKHIYRYTKTLPAGNGKMSGIRSLIDIKNQVIIKFAQPVIIDGYPVYGRFIDESDVDKHAGNECECYVYMTK